MYQWTCASPDETIAFAETLSSLLRAGDVLTLEGDLGAGKTTFTKGIANGLGIKEVVSSPTFTIIKEYEGNLPLYHMDVYRISGEEDLGFDEYLEGEGITVVEWATNIDDLLPEDYLEIALHHVDSVTRRLTLTPHGMRFEQLCKELIDYECSSH
ncbi:tRNA threonylcarbamoyladenosine biosynthesis protein TsaE [Scopulibacillus darangshiensis]|uniref:tRNA threonylcarbamoyladenosine biosynthesis protein TsaE n=1 Tax=Scopulibacillus darangshiensis TaxID=442528 RepID=A0A4R2NEI2_9BACL|nr:tRNA (adenosine(37)-N6)-threonylcarbamoyltransferase complex ATPase subunit type 1 TsaE [Scopulibacillus darangshiensis]TCP19719.1 tRNA threonylcarbamoyladenosine biosynthesis protein TsaE [Scopulibacillus darangshiensis]